MNDQTVFQPKKSSPLLNYSIAVVGASCMVCLCLIVAVNIQSPAPNSRQIAPTGIPLQDPPQYYVPVVPVYSNVEYKIVGNNGSRASITYSNEQGGTEQQDISIPWSYPIFRANPGTFLYISAQIDGTGKVTCQIFLNGKLFKTSTSSGQYVIASCDGLVP